jgi:hypothetical protein
MKFMAQRNLREKRLQEELRKEKLLFLQSAKRAASAVHRDLVLENWLRAYPSETLTLIAIAGFAAGYTIAKSQTRPTLDIPTRVYES